MQEKLKLAKEAIKFKPEKLKKKKKTEKRVNQVSKTERLQI